MSKIHKTQDQQGTLSDLVAPRPTTRTDLVSVLEDNLRQSRISQPEGLDYQQIVADVVLAISKLYAVGKISDLSLDKLGQILPLRMAGETYQAIGEQLGCTRQNIEHHLHPIKDLLSKNARKIIFDTPPRTEFDLKVLEELASGKSLHDIGESLGSTSNHVSKARDRLLQSELKEETLEAIAIGKSVRAAVKEGALYEKIDQYLELRMNQQLQVEEICEIMSLHPPELVEIMRKAEEYWGLDEQAKAWLHRKRYKEPPKPPEPDWDKINARRDVVYNLFQEGLSVTEIARTTGHPRSTIQRDVQARQIAESPRKQEE